jgi:hypothetical protein
VIATGLSANGVSIALLDVYEYERSGLSEAVVDLDFRIISPQPVATVTAAVDADKLYELAEISDGTNTMVYSIERASGKMVKLSPAGSNHTAVGIRTDGYAIYKSTRSNGPPANLFARNVTGLTLEVPVIPSRAIDARGDSLTYVSGIAANSYWYKLGVLLGWPANGFGVNGQDGRQIASRVGARPFYITLASNLLPASGAATVTVITENPITPGLPNLKIYGRVGTSGPYATLTKAGDDSVYYLTQDAGGTDVTVPAGTRFYPLGAGTGSIVMYRQDALAIIWPVRNNVHKTDDVIENIALQIAQQTPLTKRFLIPLCLYGEGDEIGTANRAVIDFTNNAIKARWPNNWVDFNGPLQNGGDGSAGDLADIANGITPRSLRVKDSDNTVIDFLHPNSAGNTIEANALYAAVQSRGWDK